jgi:hypothetical protein
LEFKRFARQKIYLQISIGFHGSTITDGGITFSDYDYYSDAIGLPRHFYIESIGSQYDAGPYFTRPNYLKGLNYSSGPLWSFTRFGSANISFGTDASEASVLILYPGINSPNILEFQALLNGEVVATDVLEFVDLPNNLILSTQLTVSSERFDALRLIASGSYENGAVFIGIDNVSITPIPEPATVLLLSLGAAILRKKARN